MKIGFIGFGSMGQAICDGLIGKGTVKPDDVYASARNWDKLAANCGQRGIHTAKSALEAASAADLIVIAALPGAVGHIMAEAGQALAGKPVVSIAAGLPFAELRKIMPEGCNVISTIPNTPVSVGAGIFVAEETNSLTAEQLKLFKSVFSTIALIEFVPSSLLDLGGTLAGCTPAYMAMVIEALADAGVKHGMPRASAYRLVEQMMLGTSEYALESGIHPGQLKDGVCSPGGTTIKGLAALESAGMRSAMIEAIDAAME